MKSSAVGFRIRTSLFWRVFPGLLFALYSQRGFAQGVEKIQFSRLESLLAGKADTTYVINFWATWCKPCVEELPAYERLNRENTGKKLKVILVSLDMPKQVNTRLIPFIRENKILSRVWFLDAVNANEWIDKVSKDWSGAIPATLVYKGSAEGYRRFYEKSFSYEELKTMLNQIPK